MKPRNIISTSMRGALIYVMKHFCEPGVTEYPELTDTYAVISIQDTAHGGFGFELKPNAYCFDVLTVYFDDIEKPQQGATLMTNEQADEIIRFIEKHRNDVSTLLIHCFAGISRSKAVERFAREILGMAQQNDDFYNAYVYDILEQRYRKPYFDFIGNVIQIMKRHGYTPAIDDDISHRSDRGNINSIDYTFTKDTIISGKRVRLVVFTRISAHDDSYVPAAELIKREIYYDGQATRYRDEGLEPKYTLVSLFAGNHKTSTYDEALTYLNRAVKDFEETNASKVERGEANEDLICEI